MAAGKFYDGSDERVQGENVCLKKLYIEEKLKAKILYEVITKKVVRLYRILEMTQKGYSRQRSRSV